MVLSTIDFLNQRSNYMKYLIIDGMVSGTGVRDVVNGGYLSTDTLGISEELSEKIKVWQNEYEDEHYNSYSNVGNVRRLDELGISIAKQLQLELPESKIEYYSSANCTKIMLSP